MNYDVIGCFSDNDANQKYALLSVCFVAYHRNVVGTGTISFVYKSESWQRFESRVMVLSMYGSLIADVRKRFRMPVQTLF